MNKFACTIAKPQSIDEMLKTWNVPVSERTIPVKRDKLTVLRDARMFWTTFGGTMPMLASLASLVYRQPISQSPAEQSLSAYKLVMTDTRARLLPSTQHKAVYCYFNLKNARKFREMGYY